MASIEFTFGCPGMCGASATYVEPDTHARKNRGFRLRGLIAAASHGWVAIADLPGRRPDFDLPGWLVCPACARAYADVAGTWLEKDGLL